MGVFKRLCKDRQFFCDLARGGNRSHRIEMQPLQPLKIYVKNSLLFAGDWKTAKARPIISCNSVLDAHRVRNVRSTSLLLGHRGQHPDGWLPS